MIGGVEELWWPVPGQDGHRGPGASPALLVLRLNLQLVLPAGRQRASRGPDVPRAPVHLEAPVTSWGQGQVEGGRIPLS